MKQPDLVMRSIVPAFIGVLLSAAVSAAPSELTDGWYRVELLIFLREDALAGGRADNAEQWEPLPDLTYPDTFAYLVVPELAERRLEESGAYTSIIDERGVQHLTVPRAAEGIDAGERPDALIREPYVEPPAEDDAMQDPNMDTVPPLLAAPPPATSASDNGDGAAPPADEDTNVEVVSIVRPEMTLKRSARTFEQQARTLRRRGNRILFHETWWTRLAEDGDSSDLILDRSGDMDVTEWPEFQGSIRIHRSRYLHLDVDLWVNTMAAYLPEGWQIEAPPRPTPSVDGMTLGDETLNPWMPLPSPLASTPDSGLEPGDFAEADFDADEVQLSTKSRGPLNSSANLDDRRDENTAPDVFDERTTPSAEPALYPWKHAIRHVQSRRMRSKETHYLDHPVIGVVVRFVPADEGNLPVADDADLAFRERHGLAVEALELPKDWATSKP